jgi:hypothetical protein
MNTTRAILLLVTFCLGSSSTFGENRVDIMQIYVNFLASGIAAVKCRATTDASEKKFLANMTAVAIRATQAAKERSGLTEAQLIAHMEKLGHAIKTKVESEIKRTAVPHPPLSNA